MTFFSRTLVRVLFGGLVLASASLLSGCASGSGYDVESRWREDMGQVLETGIEEALRKHLGRRESAGRELYYESIWISRDRVASEVLIGVIAARNRIVIRGRQLEASMSDQSTFRITLEVEVQNEVMNGVTPGWWHPAPIPDEVMERFRSMRSGLVFIFAAPPKSNGGTGGAHILLTR